MILTSLRKATSAWVIATLSAGCIPIPIAVPRVDRPPDIAIALPAEFTSGERETLVVVIYGGESHKKGSVLLGAPLFTVPAELPALANRLERSWTEVGVLMLSPFGVAASGGGGPVPVRELCVIAANGRTVSLHLRGKAWESSEVSVVDAAWRNQFEKLVSSGTATTAATLFPIWQSSPCKQVDWTQGVYFHWTDEQRARVSVHLRELPVGP